MKFDMFVIPFVVGLVFVLAYIVVRFTKWILALNNEDKARLRRHFYSKKIFRSIREIFQEALLHKKIFKTNPRLGYMHMSLAFGWFLLIVFGNIENKFYSEYSLNPPYVPIFLKFFEPDPLPHFFGRGFSFLMDLILLMVLSGVFLAFYKRFNSKALGLKRTTQHARIDKIAITALWFIFPLRLLAESFTSGIYDNGSFLTGSLGYFFDIFLPIEKLAYPAWWAYSISLGIFFVALPFSRYMHIPAEILLIVFRNSGIKAHVEITPFSKVEINSCSRCGICIDSCQMAESLTVTSIQPSYFIRDVRYNKLQSETASNCLMCGRCNSACPVGINTTEIRLSARISNNCIPKSEYNYIPQHTAPKADVIYFAGCMSHLTPAIKKAMTTVLDKSGVKWTALDGNGGICCGRPLLLSGQLESARVLIDKNIALIKSSGAKTLVTSCPICFKTFKEDYKLDIEVVHHSQYLLQLIEDEKITVSKTETRVVYHDPCELGRGSKVIYEPRVVINHVAELLPSNFEKEKGLCCGGSLANTHLSGKEKLQIASDALQKMNIGEAQCLVTACPLCKKTFQQATDVEVKDIAELVAMNLAEKTNKPLITARAPKEIEVGVFRKN